MPAMKAWASLGIYTDLPESSVQDNVVCIKAASAGSSTCTIYLGSLIIVELQIVGLDLWQHQFLEIHNKVNK